MENMIKQQSRIFLGVAIFCSALFIIFCYSASFTFNTFIFLGLFFSGSGTFYSLKELIFFESNFPDFSSHLISWEYPNGDKLIVTCWGMLKENKIPPKMNVKNKFDGFKWDHENALDLIETITTNSGNPIISLIPSIEFSTTTNQIEDYIIFGFADKIDITFVEKDEGFLIINIEKKNFNTKYNMIYPLPSNKISLKKESQIFEERINKKMTPVRAVYIEKEIVDQIAWE